MKYSELPAVYKAFCALKVDDYVKVVSDVTGKTPLRVVSVERPRGSATVDKLWTAELRGKRGGEYGLVANAPYQKEGKIYVSQVRIVAKSGQDARVSILRVVPPGPEAPKPKSRRKKAPSRPPAAKRRRQKKATQQELIGKKPVKPNKHRKVAKATKAFYAGDRSKIPQSYFLGPDKTYPYRTPDGRVDCNLVSAAIKRARLNKEQGVLSKASVVWNRSCAKHTGAATQ